MQSKNISLKTLSYFNLYLFEHLQYDPTEPGDYRVEVKWAGELVPGSPFHVMIFDTQEELRRYVSTL